MHDNIIVSGIVGTDPRSITTSEGLTITSFRVASQQRRYDRQRSAWVDGTTNWYSVSAFRRLAENVAASVSKGDRVLVAGRMRVRDWHNDTRAGVSVEIEADCVGHDLTWGRSVFSRSSPAEPMPLEKGDTEGRDENSADTVDATVEASAINTHAWQTSPEDTESVRW